MICRKTKDGWLLISQPAHAWMAGALAAAWGNHRFAVPEPQEAVLLATHLHDIGWTELDAAPRLDKRGQPLQFLQTTLDETRLIWQHGVRIVELMDPFAGILVSMHAVTIYRRRLARVLASRVERTQIQRLIDAEALFQAKQQSRLGEHPTYQAFITPERLNVCYRWLRVCDLISLAALADVMPDQGAIEQVPGADWQNFEAIRYWRQEQFSLLLKPWPFDKSPLQVTVPARRLLQHHFSSPSVYAEALSQAASLPLTVTLSDGA